MDNKAIIIIGLLFLLASTSAFVVNIQGDTIYNPDVANVFAAPSGLSVNPQTVPRYCDIKVTSSPGKQIKVYSQNYADTNLGCKTGSDGVCTFKFTSTQARGTYYISGNSLQVAVVLEPTASCVQEIKSLNIDPVKLDTAVAGTPYYFTTSAYAPDGSAVVPEPAFSLTNNSVGALSHPSITTKNQVQFVGSKAGTTMLKADYSGKTVSANVTVIPGACNAFIADELSAQYTAGDNIAVSAATMDLYNNTKPGVAMELEYTSPNGTKVSLKNSSDSSGVVSFMLPIGNLAGTSHVIVKTKDQFLCPSQSKAFYFSVVPDVPASVLVAPATNTLNVHEMVQYNARVYDKYMNEITGKEINWTSSDESVATVGQTGVATAVHPGASTIAATVYYDSITILQQCVPKLGCFNSPLVVLTPVSGTAQVIVRNGNVSYVVIQPITANVVAGAQQQFTAVLYDQYNATVPNAVYTWSAVNGTANANGLYTAPQKVGDDVVTVSSNGVSANAAVTVTNGPAARIDALSEGPTAVVNSQHTLFANVTDQFGNPVQGVVVNYNVLSGTAMPNNAQINTGVDGIASIAVTVGATEGNVLYSMNIDGTSITDNDQFTVSIPDATLSGVVADYYTRPAPLQGVLVQIEGTPYSAITDANGTYRIDNVNLNGNYSITFSKAGYQTERVDNFQILKDDQNNNYTQDMQVRVLTSISGNVRDENAQLMQNANVTLYENSVYSTSVLTDANGHYAFNVAPNSALAQFMVTATAPGYDTVSAGTMINPGVPVVLDFTLGGLDVSSPVISWVDPTPYDFMCLSGNLPVATLAADPHYAATVISVVNGSTSTQVANCATAACNVVIDTSAYPDGQVAVIATANDTRGNEASVQRTYLVDNVYPMVRVIPPTPGPHSIVAQPFTVSATADDATGISKMIIQINGTTVQECNFTTVCSFDVNNSVYNGDLQILVFAEGMPHIGGSLRSGLFFDLTVLPPQPVLTTLQISATNNSVYVDDVVNITAKALDANGQPMANVPVDYVVVGYSNSPITIITNASGDALVDFSTSITGVYTIAANSSALSNSTVITVSDVPLATVQLTAAPNNMLVGQISTVTAIVLNARGQPVANTPVAFTASGGILLPSSVNTDANGRAVAQFVSILPGMFSINASTGALQNTTGISVNVIPPASVDLVAVPNNLSTGSTSIVTATVRDALGQPISGATVNFVSDGIIAPASALTDANGRASAQFSAPVVGVYTINATAGAATNSTTVNVSAGSVPSGIQLSAMPAAISTVGHSAVTARVIDQYGAGVANQQVNFTADGGNLSAATATTNATGYATVQFSSTVVGNYTVNATSGVMQNSSSVEVTAASVATVLQLVANPVSIFAGATSTITATVLDQYGAPLANQSVLFTASNGSVAPASVNTDSNGRAIAQFSSNTAGNYMVTATAAALTNTTNVTVTQPSGNGVLNGVVSNTSGAPIQGANVTVMKNYAVIFSTTTDAAGAFSFNLPADTYDVVVTATGYLPARDYGIHVLDGSTTTRNYALTKMSRLYGTVSNSTNESVSGATLNAYRNGNLVATATSLANGGYEFILPAGVYMVETTHPNYQRSLYTLYLPPLTELAKNVTMYG